MTNPILIKNINLLSEDCARWVKDSELLIEGKKITSLHPDTSQKIEACQVVDGKGGYLMPGLFEFHGHFYGRATSEMRSQHEAYCPLYLSGGVTTVKTPGEFEPDLTWQWKQDIEKGEKVGPRIMTGGYYFDPMDTIIRWFHPCATLEEVEAAFQKRDLISDFFKVYSSMTEPWVRRVCELAHAVGKKVYGHLGKCTTTDAINAGLDGVEHGFFTVSEFYTALSGKIDDSALEALDINSDLVRRVQALLVEKQTAVTPTCLTFRLSGKWFTDWMDKVDAWRYLSAEGLEKQRNMRKDMDSKPEAYDQEQRLIEKQYKYVGELYKQGARIFAGTDPSYPMMIPGEALWLEAENLARCGLSTTDILRALTIEAAKELGVSEITGSIAVGKEADLILLAKDPLQDIRNLSNLQRVWKAGKAYDPKALKDMAVGKLR